MIAENELIDALGSLEIAHVTRDDLKRLVASLDLKAQTGFYSTGAGDRR